MQKKDMTSTILAAFAVVYGKTPEKFDKEGWLKFVSDVSMGANPVKQLIDKTGSLPTESEVRSTIMSMKSVNSDPERDDGESAGRQYVLYDYMVNKADSANKQEKLWKRTISEIENKVIPAYIKLMPAAIERFLDNNFFFTANDDGSTICYWRDRDAEGNVWFEGDSVKPFTRLHGAMKRQMNAMLALHGGDANVTVMRTNSDGKVETEHGVSLASLYKEYGKRMMTHVEKSNEEVAYNWFIDRMKRTISEIEDFRKGTKLKWRQAMGLQNLKDKYEDMDEQIWFQEQYFRAESFIKTFTNDRNEPAFAFFDLDSLKQGPTPAFDMFLSGVCPECRDSFMAAVYAAFNAKSHLNQYVWMHGEGGDGKSSFLNAMSKFAGEKMSCSLNTMTMQSEFGLEGAIGKRIVMLPDVKTGLSVKSSLIHNLTGHDLVPINRKNKPIVSVRLDPIVWIAANEAPDVNFANRNETRRLIYIKMQEPPMDVLKKIYVTDENGAFVVNEKGERQNNGFPLEEMLVKEFPHILHKCREVFERVCPAPHSVIVRNNNEQKLAEVECVDQEHDTIMSYIMETFSFSVSGASMKRTEIAEAFNGTLKSHGEKSLDKWGRTTLYRTLETVFKCKSFGVNGVRYYRDICVKSDEPVFAPATDADRDAIMNPVGFLL